MLRSLKGITGYGLSAADGDLGRVEDFYFDDASWTVRYIVADTRRWLPGRLVLISPVAAGEPDEGERVLPVALTREQVRESPPIERDKPVSRQHEAEITGYYSWPVYWTTGLPHGRDFAQPLAEATASGPGEEDRGGGEAGADPGLRSMEEVVGYRVRGADEEAGRVGDFIADTVAWAIRYLVIETGGGSGSILIAPRWIEKVDWSQQTVRIDLTGEMIRSCPEYDPDRPLDREYEQRLHEHFGRTGYWET